MTENSNEQIIQLSSFCKSLSNPTRIEIIKLIAQNKKMMVQEIIAVVPLAQSTVSEHLKVLREAQLVKVEIVGNKSYYSVRTKALEKAEKSLKKVLKSIIEQAK